MNKYSIEQVLPHKAPMILLDNLLSYDQTGACCTVKIKPESNFYRAELKGVPTYIGIEYMAQTIAAFANANQLDIGKKVEIGFLVSSRKYTTHTSIFTENSVLEVSVTRLYKEDNGLSVFECSISEQHNKLVEAQINVFQPDEPSAFLAESGL
ncbi:3-hydroxylacyl-ACP dehydratase [Catenovulum sp. 2E275]|uniref:ApeP family dehydratase n=1 Tax=Catenovulum sp. 2E275 TaxID=2980497 RepID=UPI0021CFB62E|nr:3-hydroxylacyl-ACP dehydratase [Catenovulum sp. 2E275]MCU4676648.1 3-hydroxylacyl-ACP dehydratase [Catenovulum sp. 2E275]